MTAPRHLPDRGLSRRALLQVLGGGSAAALLSSCLGGGSGDGDSGTDTSGEPGELPTGDVTFRWVDSGDQKAEFLRSYFDEYESAHQNITIQYDPLPRQEIAQVVPLGVQNGNAHDTFVLPPGVSGAQAVRDGWVAPLDGLVPDFDAWKARFPAGHFAEGLNMFDGTVYAFPIGSDRRYTTLTLYNREYMERAGYDPESQPLTWDEFRDAARKITQEGGGDYYGFIIGGGQVERWSYVVGNLAEMAGSGTATWQLAPFDWRAGEFVFTTDQHVGAVELLLAMKDDGSLFPDSVGMNAPEARAAMPQGSVGMILQGPWNIPIWQDENPDFDFGVASLPVPNEGDPEPLKMVRAGGNSMWVFADSPYKQVAGDLFAYLGSEEGQRGWAEAVGIADPPALPSVLEDVKLDERSQRAWELFEEQLRVGPEPTARSLDVAQVLLEWRAVTPGLGETIQGIMAGQLDDAAQALQEAQDRYNAELDRAIEAAQEKGAEVSREDFVFSNWDPLQDYTDEDYAAS